MIVYAIVPEKHLLEVLVSPLTPASYPGIRYREPTESDKVSEQKHMIEVVL